MISSRAFLFFLGSVGLLILPALCSQAADPAAVSFEVATPAEAVVADETSQLMLAGAVEEAEGVAPFQVEPGQKENQATGNVEFMVAAMGLEAELWQKQIEQFQAQNPTIE